MQNGSFCSLKILQGSGPVIIIYNYVLRVTTTPKYGSCLFLYKYVTFYIRVNIAQELKEVRLFCGQLFFLLTRKTAGKKIENKQPKPKVHYWEIWDIK